MAEVTVGGAPLAVDDVVRVARQGARVTLAPEGLARAALARAVVERHAAGDQPVYGVNTGLGGNVGFRLSAAQLCDFQVQLVRGRAAGVGDRLPDEVVRAALLARAHGICQGGAGAQPAVAETLVAMLNAGIVPIVPRHGSIGAGDLVLAAGLGLGVLGRGNVCVEGRVVPAAEALAAAGIEPLAPGPKDGLALINHSALTVVLASLALADLAHWLATAAAAAALAFEGYAGNPRIFDQRLAAARPARGQAWAAALFRRLLAGSSLHEPGRARGIQDPLSFRCLSQVFGTLLATFETARDDLRTELNAAADNAMVLVDDDEMLSSGNFHTPLLALDFDALAIAIASHAAASAQRVVKLMTPALSGLPAYLSPVGGASCGYVPLQKTAAALLGEIRHLANPASLDAIAALRGAGGGPARRRASRRGYPRYVRRGARGGPAPAGRPRGRRRRGGGAQAPGAALRPAVAARRAGRAGAGGRGRRSRALKRPPPQAIIATLAAAGCWPAPDGRAALGTQA